MASQLAAARRFATSVVRAAYCKNVLPIKSLHTVAKPSSIRIAVHQPGSLQPLIQFRALSSVQHLPEVGSRLHREPAAKKVVVLGSGGLSIGQAGEFDYSGSQAIKALKEEGVETVLINPNIATIQTGESLADHVYFSPLTPEFITYVIERERPDGILCTFGGQTALNCGVKLDEAGVFRDYNVKVLGTPIRTLIVSEDRELFNKALAEIDIPVATSTAVTSVADALAAAQKIGYPVIIRSAFALGGLGSGFANNPEELQQLATQSLSLSPQILVERSMKGWKEVEYEVVRDSADNCITVCNMENFDPLGIHTGDSIVVAPSQTLSDAEYHMLRTAAIKIVRHVGVVGECNVQYALNPDSMQYCVIEMNARLSRSSALASKATGYPLAFVAAKIAMGATLPEIPNAVTKTTSAFFEPSLDYIVCKIPRWDLKKFQHVSRKIGSAMKSVGEVMAIGRTFEEVIQKAIRMVDPSLNGFHALPTPPADLDGALRDATDERLFAVAHAMLDKGYSVDRLHELTKIDRWFLHKLNNIAQTRKALSTAGNLDDISIETLRLSKQQGFSDKQIAQLINSDEPSVRSRRKGHNIIPFVKQIDTLAAEFPAATNYLYTTYNASENDVTFAPKNEGGVLVLGSGVYRIGSSVEFDWCGVSCTRSLRKLGKKTVMLNYNPETVSTDFDECDRLYFEELSLERVMDVYELEGIEGAIMSVGGQLPQNICLPLYKRGFNVIGTSPVNVDAAEDRYKFSKVLDAAGVDQPAWKELTTKAEAEAFANKVGYPVLVRPSYVLSGAAMSVVYSKQHLHTFLDKAAAVSAEHPVVITKFIENAREIDIDAVADGGKVLVHAVSEHVENAGVHSGDATLILPSRNIPPETLARLKVVADKVANALQITGPFNMQIIWKDDELKVIECNLRASRSFPFVSKVLGINFIDVATKAYCGVPQTPLDLMAVQRDYQAIKVPQFSYTRLAGADPLLSVEMASTGEVACFGKDAREAYLLGLLSVQNFRLPKRNVLLGLDDLSSIDEAAKLIKQFTQQGHGIIVTPTGAAKLRHLGVPLKEVALTSDRRQAKKELEQLGVDMVISIARSRPTTTDDENYLIRRLAVDFGIPLVNDSKCALLFADALPLRNQLKSAVRRWADYVKPV